MKQPTDRRRKLVHKDVAHQEYLRKLEARNLTRITVVIPINAVEMIKREAKLLRMKAELAQEDEYRQFAPRMSGDTKRL